MSVPLHSVPRFDVPAEVLDLVADVYEQRDTARLIAVALEQENDALLALLVRAADAADGVDVAWLGNLLRAGLEEIQAVNA